LWCHKAFHDRPTTKEETMFNPTPRFTNAVAFATAAHANQSRKYSGRPYIEHPVAVARMVSRFVHDEDMLLAAVLHDTVEDTPVSVEDVARAFGEPVALLVADLTDVSRLSDGNRAVRKQRDLAHTAAARPRAKTVKLMDLVHNCVSIVRHDDGFALHFLREMQAALAVLRDASDPAAWEFAQRMHVRSCERLETRRLEAALR
jgi:(p)ppGpp synthase/HD superfamily hydrolase